MNVMTKASDMLKAEWKVSMTPDDIYRHSMDSPYPGKAGSHNVLVGRPAVG